MNTSTANMYTNSAKTSIRYNANTSSPNQSNRLRNIKIQQEGPKH